MDSTDEHALARARALIAALADQAGSVEASSAYEHALIELDRIHDDQSPTLGWDLGPGDRQALFRETVTAIQGLRRYEVDPLGVELVVAILERADELDHR